MAKRRADPTPVELEILRVLWARPEAMVRDVVDVLSKGRAASTRSFNATATTMGRMVEKGLIRCTDERKPRRYAAIVGQDETFESIVSNIKQRVFGGSLAKLVQHAFGPKRLKKAEAEEVRRMLDEHDAKEKPPGDDREAARRTASPLPPSASRPRSAGRCSIRSGRRRSCGSRSRCSEDA